jgi:hypothetical protein
MRFWFLALLSFVFAAEAADPPSEPALTSIHPVSGGPGQTYNAVIRGNNLKGARAVEFGVEAVRAEVLRVDEEAAESKDKKVDLLQVRISIDQNAKPDIPSFRVLTPQGITNEIRMRVAAGPVQSETERIKTVPVVVTGRIEQRGEADEFWFEAQAGRTLTFQAFSGHTSFDPSLSLLQPNPTWLDPKRMERIAFNDEPLFFPGLSTDAHLVHTFTESGKYCLRLQSFTGLAGPDAVYELRISPGEIPPPPLHPKENDRTWEERQFTRPLTSTRLQDLARRAGLESTAQPPEIYRASRKSIPVVRAPAIVEGRINEPAEAHHVRLAVEKPQDIAIEIETPEATMPRFNPVVLMMEPGGAEIATNVYTKRNNNGLYMMKMIQPKTTVSLRAPGEYLLEIRDITTDCAGSDFAYRVLIRPQIPHIGDIQVAGQKLNLRPGTTSSLNITFEREEDFSGTVAFTAEGLPARVTVVSGAANPKEKPPLPNGGKLERYTPRMQNTALLFVTAPDAAPTPSPVAIRVVARPLANSVLGDPIIVKELPVVIVPESTAPFSRGSEKISEPRPEGVEAVNLRK